MLSNYTYSKYAINKGYNDDVKLFAPYYFELVSNPRELEIGYWEFKDCQIQINSSYFIFAGSGPTPPSKSNYWKEVYKNEKPFKNIDNKWYYAVWRGDENNDWRNIKFQINTSTINPFVIDNDGDRDLIIADLLGDLVIAIGFKKSVASWINDNGTYFESVYRWNNDSEPPKPIIDHQTGQIIDWNLGNNKNNINNNDNSEIEVTVKNKDISENPVYQLEANYFNWLSITNKLETNNIPSLIPAEIKLSDGEYGKYLTNLIVANEKIENYLNYFSQWYRLLYSKAVWMIIIKDLVLDAIKIIFDKKLFNLNQIDISGIWGYGNYDITIFTEKEQININNLKLFNRNNEKLSLITLEI